MLSAQKSCKCAQSKSRAGNPASFYRSLNKRSYQCVPVNTASASQYPTYQVLLVYLVAKKEPAFWANAINQCAAAMHKLSHSPTLTTKSWLCPSWRLHVFRYSCRRAFGWYPSRCLGGFSISECAPEQQFCWSACSQMNPTEPPCIISNVYCMSCEPHAM